MLTLTSAIQRNIVQSGSRLAVVGAEGNSTWAAFGQRIARAAAMLRNLGVEPGETFAIVARNGERCFELMHAAYWLGAIPVPVNVRLAAPEIAAILEDARCRIVAVESPFLDLFRSAQLAHWSERLLSLDDQGGACRWAYGRLLEQAQPIEAARSLETNVALLLYTGGTTGRSKGVPLSQRNVISNALQVTSKLHFGQDDIFLHVAPMFHSADLLATAVTLHGGAHAFLPQFSPEALARSLERERATVTMLAPTMVTAILGSEAARAHDCSSLRQLIYGSSPMAVDAIQRALAFFDGVELAQGYGLTETSPLLTLLTMAAHRDALKSNRLDRLGCAGQALPGVDLQIVNDAGEPQPTGLPGEIWVRGPNVAAGYLNAREDDRAAFTDGWFRTGDVGRLDSDGYLTILDRLKDMIITGGENVYSGEVEAILALHPGIQEAAVIGVPDSRFGEALLAVVVCRPGHQLAVEEMIAHCREHIGGYKVPRQLRVVPELPRSSLGKILKANLRRDFAKLS